jgi:hypothetical protein
MRTPFAVMAVLLVALLALGFQTEGDDEQGAAPAAAPVDVIATRVQALRRLRFEQLPEPLEVTSEQARREGLESLDRDYPAERRRADETVYKLLGLIEPGADLRELSGDLFGEGVAGYYDPRDGRLRVVQGSGTGTRVLEEMILAHELTHALEDQRFGLETTPATDDRTLARSALYEGSATALMYAYVREYFTTEETLGGLLSSAFEDTGDLPPFLQAQVLFAYVGGEAFVSELLERGGWSLVDTAFEVRPPASTEQILHPDAYFEADEPEPVRIRRVLGGEWERALAGTWGELQTRELLGGSSEAAAGWGGDRYELWQRGGDSALVMRWRWDTPRDEAEFAARLREVMEGRGVVVRRGGAVTLAVAADRDTAERLAGA